VNKVVAKRVGVGGGHGDRGRCAPTDPADRRGKHNRLCRTLNPVHLVISHRTPSKLWFYGVWDWQ
jgi:hypothetical protein